MNTLDRRRLLGGLAAFGGCTILSRPPLAAILGPGRDGATPGTLVLLQLSGGNDGLSTVIPYDEDGYGRARSLTRFTAADVLRIDDHVGLNPNLEQLRKRYDDGEVAIVQGVGYPSPNRSHFKSLDIWHSASPSGRSMPSGWIGRLCERGLVTHHPEQVVHVGAEQPYSLHSRTHPAASFRDPGSYRWIGNEEQMGDVAERGQKADKDRAKPSDALRHLRSVMADASNSSATIREAVAAHRPVADYPRGAFGDRLRSVGALVLGGIGCRVVSVEHTGYDTHVMQRSQHDRLMAELDEGLAALTKDLASSEAGRRAVIVVYSEFGRRVKENGSRGTDHGTAGPMFALGPRVKGGLHGRYPSLDRLDNGDLIHTTDFRSVYASTIEGVFGLDSEVVLGERYMPLPLFG